MVPYAATVGHSLRLIASSRESGRPLQGSRATVNCLSARAIGHPPWHNQMPMYGTNRGSNRNAMLSFCCGKNMPQDPSERRGVNNFSAVPALGEPTRLSSTVRPEHSVVVGQVHRSPDFPKRLSRDHPTSSCFTSSGRIISASGSTLSSGCADQRNLTSD